MTRGEFMKASTITSLGNTSLAVSIGGLVATELALRQGWVTASGWKIVLHAFEAATIGGLADWFAVSALFREVPVPLIRRHTNIIIKNRQRIVDGIADMVQNRWLAPRIIREYLMNFSASQYLLDFLANHDHLETVLGTARDIIRQFARGVAAPEVAGFLERTLKDQLRDLKFAEPLGHWLGQRIRSGDHHRAWNTLLPVMEKTVQGPEVKAILQLTIVRAFETYKDGGLLKRLAINLAHGLNIVNEEEIVASFAAKMAEAIRAAQSDPAHPLRARIDGIVIEFADKLAAGDADAVAVVAKLQAALINGTDLREILQRTLSSLSDAIEKAFQESGSDFNNLMRRTLRDRLDIFRLDRSSQEKVDRWVTDIALELMEKRHEMIGQMVRGSLEKLSDLDLVGQIEEKVGRDLQYIRLNGAIVGGLVGAILAIIKLLT
jgi:uncharacterized membrane-anchored protein YjiN (DUF445 family)